MGEKKPIRTRSRLALPPKEYKRVKLGVFAREKYRCRVCGQRKGLDPHHIIKRSHGGDDASWNLLGVCRNCHDAIELYWVLVVAKNGDPDAPINADEGVRIILVNKQWKPGTPPNLLRKR
jgi:predicted restriction endonuclease